MPRSTPCGSVSRIFYPQRDQFFFDAPPRSDCVGAARGFAPPRMIRWHAGGSVDGEGMEDNAQGILLRLFSYLQYRALRPPSDPVAAASLKTAIKYLDETSTRRDLSAELGKLRAEHRDMQQGISDKNIDEKIKATEGALRVLLRAQPDHIAPESVTQFLDVKLADSAQTARTSLLGIAAAALLMFALPSTIPEFSALGVKVEGGTTLVVVACGVCAYNLVAFWLEIASALTYREEAVAMMDALAKPVKVCKTALEHSLPLLPADLSATGASWIKKASLQLEAHNQRRRIGGIKRWWRYSFPRWLGAVALIGGIARLTIGVPAGGSDSAKKTAETLDRIASAVESMSSPARKGATLGAGVPVSSEPQGWVMDDEYCYLDEP